MRAEQTSFIEGRVAEEIRRAVAEAIAGGDTISTSEYVAKISAVYPNCGLSKRQIADEIMMAAAAAGVAVEIGVTDRASTSESARQSRAS